MERSSANVLQDMTPPLPAVASLVAQSDPLEQEGLVQCRAANDPVAAEMHVDPRPSGQLAAPQIDVRKLIWREVLHSCKSQQGIVQDLQMPTAYQEKSGPTSVPKVCSSLLYANTNLFTKLLPSSSKIPSQDLLALQRSCSQR